MTSLREFFMLSEGAHFTLEPESNGEGTLIRWESDEETGDESSEAVARGGLEELLEALYETPLVGDEFRASEDMLRQAWEQCVSDGDTAVSVCLSVDATPVEVVPKTRSEEESDGFDPDELSDIEGFE
jgi:hypothetical protein